MIEEKYWITVNSAQLEKLKIVENIIHYKFYLDTEYKEAVRAFQNELLTCQIIELVMQAHISLLPELQVQYQAGLEQLEERLSDREYIAFLQKLRQEV